jgi:hypothetical protein
MKAGGCGSGAGVDGVDSVDGVEEPVRGCGVGGCGGWRRQGTVLTSLGRRFVAALLAPSGPRWPFPHGLHISPSS